MPTITKSRTGSTTPELIALEQLIEQDGYAAAVLETRVTEHGTEYLLSEQNMRYINEHAESHRA